MGKPYETSNKVEKTMRTMEGMIRELSEVLEGKKYVLIGGIASAIHGIQRYTRDADIVLTVTKEELHDLIKKLKEHGFEISKSYEENFTDKILKRQPAKILYSNEYSVDFRVGSYTIDKESIQRAQPYQIYDRIYLVATPEDIVVYKMARFSGRDQFDIQGIVERNGNKLDIAYIKKSAEQLIKEIKEPLLKKDMKDHFPRCLSLIEKSISLGESVKENSIDQNQPQEQHQSRGRHR